MLRAAFALLSLAVLLGATLAALQAARRAPRGWWFGALHGATGAVGFAALALGLRAAARRGPYEWDAAVLLAAALATGLTVAGRAWLRRRPSGGLLLAHMGAASIGYLLIIGFAFG